MKTQLRHQWFLAEFKLRNSRWFATTQSAPRVFFPGCSLPAASHEVVARTLEVLRRQDPDIGLWFECCGRPVRKFGNEIDAQKEEDALWQRMQEAGVMEVITACGNCNIELKRFTDKGLKLTSVYELLAKDVEWLAQVDTKNLPEMIVHHPCSARVETHLVESFFRLTDGLNLSLENRSDKSYPLSCCLAKTPISLQKRETVAHKEMLTYCGHCTQEFQQDVSSRHILQVVTGDKSIWKKLPKWKRFRNYRRLVKQWAK